MFGFPSRPNAGDVLLWRNGQWRPSPPVPTPLTAPVNMVAPAVTGGTGIGDTLTSDTGIWTGYPAPTFTYQWQKDGVDLGGETASTYEVTSSGAHRCFVTATNIMGTPAAVASNVITSV
jgi:hypothetical protein